MCRKFLLFSLIIIVFHSAAATNSIFSEWQKKKILLVVSNASYYGETDIHTANHFAEIVLPIDEFIKAGYEVDIISPEGGTVPIGYIQHTYATIQKYLFDCDFMSRLKNTLRPEDVDASNYDAIFFAGGGAAMFGVHDNPKIQALAIGIYEKNNGLVAAVCHGTAGIANLKLSNGEYLVKGKKINGFPDIFEDKESAYFKSFPFSIQEQIEKNGGQFLYSEKGWDGYLQEDERVITGQDPHSARAVAAKVVQSLIHTNF